MRFTTRRDAEIYISSDVLCQLAPQDEPRRDELLEALTSYAWSHRDSETLGDDVQAELVRLVSKHEAAWVRLVVAARAEIDECRDTVDCDNAEAES